MPEPNETLGNLSGTPLEQLTQHDPNRVLYNAIVPFAVAAIEHFFGQTYRIMLTYDKKAQENLKNNVQKKIEIQEVLRIQNGEITLEDVIAKSYSFQNIASIHKAFYDWFSINFWEIIRKRKKVGRKIPVLEERLNQVVEFRHGVVHRFDISLGMTKKH